LALFIYMSKYSGLNTKQNIAMAMLEIHRIKKNNKEIISHLTIPLCLFHRSVY